MHQGIEQHYSEFVRLVFMISLAKDLLRGKHHNSDTTKVYEQLAWQEILQ